jgi:hypothetical protein
LTRPDPVNERSGNEAKQQPHKYEPKEKPLSGLGAREPEFVNEGRVKNRKTIIENTHGKEEIQEGCESNPPAVINSLHARILRVLLSAARCPAAAGQLPAVSYRPSAIGYQPSAPEKKGWGQS